VTVRVSKTLSDRRDTVREGPIGGVFSALRANPERTALLAHVSVIGLGVGSIAAYAKHGESFVFFEIDPEVIRIARDPTMFSFLKDCEGRPRSWSATDGSRSRHERTARSAS
jgi:hypothetical protein